jgi:hypothetical protein
MTTDDLTMDEFERLPKWALIRLRCPAGEGERRHQIRKLLPALMGEGISAVRCYEILRPRYAEDFTDQELNGLIKWFEQRRESFTSSKNFTTANPAGNGRRPAKIELPNEQRIAKAEKFLDGFRLKPQSLAPGSIMPIRAATPAETANLLLESIHRPAGLISVITDYVLDKNGKACPRGPGKTMSAAEWASEFRRCGVPHSDAGCRFHLNSVRPANLKEGKNCYHGMGYDGSWTNGDIERFDWMIAESDILPLDMQAAIIVQLSLPIAYVIDTGGKSLHTGIGPVSCPKEAEAILESLYPLGFDRETKHPRQLERMPGDLRKIKARDEQGTEQRLLYLNPRPTGEPIITQKHWRGDV